MYAMQLLFVDESGDQKHKQYFGICVAAINSAHYRTAKTGFHKALRASGWNEDIEFKGSHLFAASKGDKSISVEKRIDIATAILDLNKAESNARMRFHYFGRHDCDNPKAEYLTRLPQLVRRALPPTHKKAGKDLVSINCDQRSDISASEIQDAILPVLTGRGYTLVEEVATVRSSFHTVGVLYADLVSYLSARIDTISSDAELFEGLSHEEIEQSGKLRKLKSSTALIGRVKRLDRHKLAER
jgi:hypothetical protein